MWRSKSSPLSSTFAFGMAITKPMLILSYLDYCNSLLIGLPASSLTLKLLLLLISGT